MSGQTKSWPVISEQFRSTYLHRFRTCSAWTNCTGASSHGSLELNQASKVSSSSGFQTLKFGGRINKPLSHGQTHEAIRIPLPGACPLLRQSGVRRFSRQNTWPKTATASWLVTSRVNMNQTIQQISLNSDTMLQFRPFKTFALLLI